MNLRNPLSGKAREAWAPGAPLGNLPPSLSNGRPTVKMKFWVSFTSLFLYHFIPFAHSCREEYSIMTLLIMDFSMCCVFCALFSSSCATHPHVPRVCGLLLLVYITLPSPVRGGHTLWACRRAWLWRTQGEPLSFLASSYTGRHFEPWTSRTVG